MLANRLGVRQRSLYFALVTHAPQWRWREKYISKKVIGAAYTMLDGERTACDDDFFRVRALEAKFDGTRTISSTMCGTIDDTVDKIEKKDLTKFQVMVNMMFRTLRTLNRAMPFLPGKRFWRFNNMHPHRADPGAAAPHLWSDDERHRSSRSIAAPGTRPPTSAPSAPAANT